MKLTCRSLLPAAALALLAATRLPAADPGGDRTRPLPSATLPAGSTAITVPAERGIRPKLRIYNFTMDGTGIRLVQSTTATGRVKSPPATRAAHRLEFEVRNAKGLRLQAGAVEHPLWQELEGESPPGSGRLQRFTHRISSGGFQLRLPASTGKTSVTFTEVIHEAGKSESRRPLGVVKLP